MLRGFLGGRVQPDVAVNKVETSGFLQGHTAGAVPRPPHDSGAKRFLSCYLSPKGVVDY